MWLLIWVAAAQFTEALCYPVGKKFTWREEISGLFNWPAVLGRYVRRLLGGE